MRIPTSQSAKNLPLLALVLLVLLAAGCSSTVFVYNRLPHFIPWYVDDYVDLDDSQEKQLDELLDAYLQAHRQDALPRYREIIDQLVVALDEPLTIEKADQVYALVEVEFNQLQADTLDWMLAMGETLSDRQVEAFILKLKARQSEYENEYLQRNEARFQHDVYSDLKRNFKEYLGRLEPQQSQLLRDTANQLQRLDQYWLTRRQHRIDQLVVILERQPRWQQQVVELMNDPTVPGAQEYEQYYRHNLQHLLQATVTLVNGRSDRQDRHLKRKLLDLRRDIDHLSRQQHDS